MFQNLLHKSFYHLARELFLLRGKYNRECHALFVRSKLDAFIHIEQIHICHVFAGFPDAVLNLCTGDIFIYHKRKIALFLRKLRKRSENLLLAVPFL